MNVGILAMKKIAPTLQRSVHLQHHSRARPHSSDVGMATDAFPSPMYATKTTIVEITATNKTVVVPVKILSANLAQNVYPRASYATFTLIAPMVVTKRIAAARIILTDFNVRLPVNALV